MTYQPIVWSRENATTATALPSGAVTPPGPAKVIGGLTGVGFDTTPEATVRVRLELAGNLQHKVQKDLTDQVRALLELIGFREAAAYDNRGTSGRPYTRLVGQVTMSTLEVLLKAPPRCGFVAHRRFRRSADRFDGVES